MNITVTSPSFSSNKTLQQEIYKYFPKAKLNLDGKRFNKKDLIEYIKDADAIIVGLEPIDKEVLEQCQNLKIVSKYGVGLNNIDLEACKKRDITIGWTGGVNKLSVAEMTLGYMLMLCRNLFITSNELKNGIWNKSGGFQLSEKRIGIIGVGYIGKELIRLLKPFNCEILVNDIINQEQYYKENNLKEVSKEEIFKTCDIVTIHTPFDSTTDNLIDKKVFETMKNGSFIINSARGGIINEDDLKYALLNNIISGAAIDAYVEEPPSDKELLSLPNLICTPHIGGNSREAVEAMGLSAINHLKEFYNL
ncbi:phosphoglycerate dehydrogenase [Aliarcobacter butzleri]|jgi:D-3-phosphoglycerate dehydrogenase|uniref:phosphoglycerate dehydrogenase n=1 Tax=Aliarcobacter butzleri TaxID=28197 RepID=UPI0012606A8E|nr:phosphoglycerate dehydrogenase [Aliarcobacter butzleri]MDN5126633.1 phosphoglycerate dehydrogenase [Aliarcobacter butzleri]